MEHKLNHGFSLLIAISVILAGCTKIEDFPAGESVNQRFVQSMDWNKSHSDREIVVQSDTYSILAMADSHVGGTENLDSFLRIVKTSDASAVVMVGDLTGGKKEDYILLESHLPFQDPLPIYLIAGNHDLFNNSWKEFYTRFGSSIYFFTVKTPVASDLYICLDTGSGTLGERQLEWLTNILQTMRPEYRHCMAFTHNNLLRARHSLSTNPLVEELDILIELFTKYNVEMVITGHDHEKDATLFGLTTYIQIGALKDGSPNASYFQVRVNNDNIEYEFENL